MPVYHLKIKVLADMDIFQRLRFYPAYQTRFYFSTWGAFAAVVKDGTVLTWPTSGGSDYGGDSRSVQAALSAVDKIYSTGYAFAAVVKDGTVVTWGVSRYGGDSRSVQAALRRVDEFYSRAFAFATVFGGYRQMPRRFRRFVSQLG